MSRKTVARAIGRYVLRGLVCVVRWLPFSVALALGRGLGTLARLLSRKRYRVALKNLRIAYGDTLREAERERIAKECFRQFGMFVIENIKFAYMSQEEVDRRIHAEAYKVFQEVMAGHKGCLFLTGHLGNFEIAARWLTARGYELIALAREARDSGTTDLMTRLRQRSGIQVIALGQSLRPVLAGLQRNACVAIICDQNAADVFVPFFGHPTGTVDGPARIALKMGTPMVFFCCVRDGQGGYRLEIHGLYRAEPTGDQRADIARVMTEVNRHLEAMIRAHPEQWLWFHDRWKSSPL